VVKFLRLTRIFGVIGGQFGELLRIQFEVCKLKRMNHLLEQRNKQLNQAVRALNSEGLITTASLSAAITSLKEEIRTHEDEWFLAHRANMTDQEIELIAAGLIHGTISRIDGQMIVALLAKVRYYQLNQ